MMISIPQFPPASSPVGEAGQGGFGGVRWYSFGTGGGHKGP